MSFLRFLIPLIFLSFLCTAQEMDPDTNLFNEEEIAWIKKHPVIYFGYEANWPPYEIYENGEYSGISGDYIKMIEIHTDIDMVPVPDITWEESVIKLKKGELKVAALASATANRKEYLNFTKPHISDPYVIVTRSDFKFINGVDDIANNKIVLPKNYSTQGLLENEHPDIHISHEKNVKDCLYAVSTGKADAFVGSLSVASYYINHYGFSNLKIAPTHFEYRQLGLAVTKDFTQFRDIVEKIFDHLSKKEHIAIRNKWVTVTIEDTVISEKTKNYIIYGLIIIGIVLSGFAFWNKILRNEINRRKKVEQDLVKKNEEKEILLKEVHHRVKNNLQIVHSMLNMQSRRVDDDLTQRVLSESKSRVMSMAIIHKILYESEDLSTICMLKYVKSLTNNVERVFKNERTNITIDIDVQEVFLDIEKAIPIGLILNELLSNSYKHAFKNRSEGTIKINIQEKESKLYFVYSDDGEGVTNYNLKSYKTLGMNLVYRLAHQLQTEADIHKTSGFNLSFSFKG